MRLLGLDFETTGLDHQNDRVTELGVCLWDVELKRPLATVGVFMHEENFPKLSPKIVELTGLTDEILAEFGTCPKKNFEWLERFCKQHKIDYIVAHNGENFDKPFLLAELDRHGVDATCLRSLPWIDTRTDIPFPTEPDSRRLRHLALDCGFINPFEHRAVFDVLTMLKVLSHYPLEDVLAYQKLPFVTARAVVPAPWEDEGKGIAWAKAQRFSWEKAGDKNYPKCWVKRVKSNQLDDLKKLGQAGGFEVRQID